MWMWKQSPTPFALSSSKGLHSEGPGFDRLSPNGVGSGSVHGIQAKLGMHCVSAAGQADCWAHARMDSMSGAR